MYGSRGSPTFSAVEDCLKLDSGNFGESLKLSSFREMLKLIFKDVAIYLEWLDLGELEFRVVKVEAAGLGSNVILDSSNSARVRADF